MFLFLVIARGDVLFLVIARGDVLFLVIAVMCWNFSFL
jgi:hypothetical protein